MERGRELQGVDQELVFFKNLNFVNHMGERLLSGLQVTIVGGRKSPGWT